MYADEVFDGYLGVPLRGDPMTNDLSAVLTLLALDILMGSREWTAHYYISSSNIASDMRPTA